MRKSFFVFGAALLCLGGVGCEALLGSFEVAPGGTNEDAEAGAEGGAGADGGETSTDAAVDGPIDPNQLLMKCALGTERLLENDVALPFDRFLKVFHIGNRVKIVTRKKGQPGPTIFAFDPKGGTPPSKLTDLAKAGGILDVRRNAIQSSLSVLMYEQDVTNGVARFVVWEVPDADSSRPFRIPVSADIKLPFDQSNSGANGALDLYAAPGEYFWAASVPSIERPGSGAQAIVVGHASPGNLPPYPSTIYEGPAGGSGSVRELFRSGPHVYLFDDKGPEPGSTAGGSYFQVPETLPAGGGIVPAQRRSLAPVGAKPLVMMAAERLLPLGGRAVVAEIDFSGQGDVARILAGEFSQAELTSAAGMNASNLPLAFSLTTLTEAPMDRGEMRLAGPDFVWIGGAQVAPPATGPAPGLNFMWFDVKARAMRGRYVGANRLLITHAGITASSATLAGAATPIMTDLDIAWVEENAAVGSGLFYAPMGCVK